MVRTAVIRTIPNDVNLRFIGFIQSKVLEAITWFHEIFRTKYTTGFVFYCFIFQINKSLIKKPSPFFGGWFGKKLLKN